MWKINVITIERPTEKETFTCRAKVFDVDSEFGIYGGRVSKLEMRNSAGKLVVHYDRGWDIEPETLLEQSALLDIINIHA